MNIIASKIIEILREGLSTQRGIQTFYIGNPNDLAAADLPCIFVTPQTKTIEQLDNVHDLITGVFVIGVCVDPSKYASKDPDVDKAGMFLMEIEGGRDADGDPLPHSLAYVLRHNFTLDNAVLHQEHRTVWGEREMAGGVAQEIHCYFTVRQKVRNT